MSINVCDIIPSSPLKGDIQTINNNNKKTLSYLSLDSEKCEHLYHSK